MRAELFTAFTEGRNDGGFPHTTIHPMTHPFLQLLGVPIGLLYANAMEWLIHKYLLHGLGKNKASFFSFHWHEHHRESRRGDMFDPQYVRPLFTWSPQGKEALSIVALI